MAIMETQVNATRGSNGVDRDLGNVSTREDRRASILRANSEGCTGRDERVVAWPHVRLVRKGPRGKNFRSHHASSDKTSRYRNTETTGTVRRRSGAACELVALNEISDETLMSQFQGGDRAALATLVGRHKTSIFNFILRQVRDRSVAEDLTQDMFVRVVQSAASFKHEARFTTWAYAIARNLCIDHLRKSGLRRHASLDQPIHREGAAGSATMGAQLADERPDASAERALISSDIGARVNEAVQSLPAEQREVFLLRQLGKIPFKEIAKITGAQENTVKSRMRYALERLQEALSDYEDVAGSRK